MVLLSSPAASGKVDRANNMRRIIIVGGGIVGAGLAYALRNEPIDVVLLERNQLGAGTTSASIAVFMWWALEEPNAFEQELRERSWATYEPLIESGKISFEQIGALHCARSETRRQAYHEAADDLRSFGLDASMLAEDQLAELNVAANEPRRGLFIEESGYLDPTEIMQVWSEAAMDSGVDIRTGWEVTDVETADGQVTAVRANSQRVQADHVVNAAGPWSHKIADMVDIELPVRHSLGRILVLQTNAEVSLPFVIFENGDYFRQEGSRQAFAGRFETEYADAQRHEPDTPRRVETEFKAGMAESIPERVPQLQDAEVVNEWVGLRTLTPDGMPLLGPTAIDGFHLATGMNGEGVTNAPVLTQALARQLMQGSDEIADRLRIDRFQSDRSTDISPQSAADE